MKKLNFNNQGSEDDEKIINLLKTSIGRKPSQQFVKNTLEKVLIFRTEQRRVFKPLKFPLYLMSFIGIVLLTPIFLTFSSQVSLTKLGLEFENPFENMGFQLDLWYALTSIVLALVLMSVVWIQLGFVKFRNPFI